ncbi:MAG: response regulator [Acidobacteria bacterium]|nr:response regulator [Acidobacteriota bacterium]MCI0720988.1 response regulator [Acidobacteriota bacterium]
MEDRKKNAASSSESATSRLELSKETIIDFEKRNTKVLIADDDDTIRSLIDEILKTEHVPTTVCSSGVEALDLIKREDFGIIITDIKIRDFDGMGLLKAAKVINPNSDVIIITGYPTVETAVTAMRFGAAEYFTKPFGVEQLRKSVNRLIEKRILERKLKVEKHQMEIQRFDEETGLFTNRYFHLLLSHEITRSGRFNHTCGLLLTQIGGLKSLQESEVDTAVLNGDSVMKSVSRLLRSCCRQIDFISRYSYDEFAFVLPESGDIGVEAVAGRVRGRVDSLNGQLAGKGAQPRLTPIFGGATYPQGASTKELLLSRANQNLLKNRS